MGTSPVSKPRPISRVSSVSPERTLTPATGLLPAWTRFWFAPTDPVGLHVVRVAAGLVFLAWLLPLAGHVEALFGLAGYFDRQAYGPASSLIGAPFQPPTWSLVYLCGADATRLTALYWLSIIVLVL